MHTTTPCKHHTDTAAVGRCTGCAEAFCADCLVEVHHRYYCAECKWLPVNTKVFHEEATEPSPEANLAFGLAIFGVVVSLLLAASGYIHYAAFLIPILTISTANHARQRMNEHPQYTGFGKMLAAMLLSIISLLVCGAIGLAVLQNPN